MLTKKATFPVVATALIIVVAVVAVIGFQSWFGTYSSETYVKAEKDSKGTSNTQIQALVGNQLYFKNSLDENISIEQIKVGNKECNISLVIEPGIQNISLGNCIENLNSKVNDVVIISDDEVYEKKINFKDIKVVPIPIIQYFLDANYISAPEGNYFNTPWLLINISANESIQSCSLNFNGSITSAFTIRNDSCWINQTLTNYGVYNYNVTVVGNNSGTNLTSTKSLNYQLQCIAGSQIFTHTGDYQTFDVPLGCTNFTVKMWGAGGGGGAVSTATLLGGAGGFTIAYLTINDSIQNFSVIVGGRGVVVADWASCSGNLGGFGGGGNGGSHIYGNGYCSASGGGRSAIRINDIEMITAGGGGGNGNWAGNGGPGGGTLGGNGNGGYQTVGYGGTQVSGGAAGTVSTGGTPAGPGTQFQGGRGGDYDTTASGACSGGGGGGGFFGGGGGSQDSNAGGGSGYCGGSDVTICTTFAGSGRIPPQTGDVDYQAGIGYGGNPQQNGGHGLVVISWS